MGKCTIAWRFSAKVAERSLINTVHLYLSHVNLMSLKFIHVIKLQFTLAPGAQSCFLRWKWKRPQLVLRCFDVEQSQSGLQQQNNNLISSMKLSTDINLDRTHNGEMSWLHVHEAAGAVEMVIDHDSTSVQQFYLTLFFHLYSKSCC